MSDSNKTWKVTIELAVVATEDPIVDDAFFNHMYKLVSDDYDMGSTVEGAILMGAEAVELTAQPRSVEPTPAAEPPPAEPVPPVVPHSVRTRGKREWRVRTGTGLPFGLQEFAYYSSDYRNVSKKMGIGTHTTRNKRECVWLTEAEVVEVYSQVMGRRADQEARRAAKGGE